MKQKLFSSRWKQKVSTHVHSILHGFLKDGQKEKEEKANQDHGNLSRDIITTECPTNRFFTVVFSGYI